MANQPAVCYTLFLGVLLLIGASQARLDEDGFEVDDSAPPCRPLSKELLQQYAKDNVVLVTVFDMIVMKRFGRSWVENVKSAGISYWLVGALDPASSKYLGAMGVKQCFNAPHEALRHSGQAESKYQWGSHHWHLTTWNKVHVVRAVYALGFHVIFSDSDSSWFRDPMPYFQQFMNGPVHAIFSVDSLETSNKPDDQGLEAATTPHININTGIYFIRQFDGGLAFFAEWLRWQDKNVGHDQDGFNTVVRGQYRSGDMTLPTATMTPMSRLIDCALNKTVKVSLLPASMFGNAYTYANNRLHEKVHHPLYVIHWVWSGPSFESKRQNMRDAGKYVDPPGYYKDPKVITMDMWRPKAPPGYDVTPFEKTEDMVRFHVTAANQQLQQEYYGFALALTLNRTFVLPWMHCFCSKNWYMTQSCRINGEPHGTFPFNCSLSQLHRAKRLTGGLKVEDAAHHKRVVHVREYSFMENPRVPQQLQASRAVVFPAAQPRPEGNQPLDLGQVVNELQPDGTMHTTVPWPLDDVEVTQVLAKLQDYRVLHFTNATKIFKRFRDPAYHDRFDAAVSRMAAYWCCRSPKDQAALNATDKIQLSILPLQRARSQPAASASHHLFS